MTLDSINKELAKHGLDLRLEAVDDGAFHVFAGPGVREVVYVSKDEVPTLTMADWVWRARCAIRAVEEAEAPFVGEDN